MGETKRRLEKEHKHTCTRYLTDKSAIAEHAWACMGERPPNQLGRNEDFAASQPQHGTPHEGSTKYTHDARGRMLQQRQRVRATLLLDRYVQKSKGWGQLEQRPPTTRPRSCARRETRHAHRLEPISLPDVLNKKHYFVFS